MIDTTKPLVRLLLALAAVAFTPCGVWVLLLAFAQNQPHIFVMLVFSGSLTILVGLVGLVGFVASFVSKGASRGEKPKHENEGPPAL